MDWSVVTQLGAASAAVVTVYLFLKYMAKERGADRKMWENHLSQTVIVLQRLYDGQEEHRKNTEK
jgi:hypothetical protein